MMVQIPTSVLGALYGTGEVVSRWGNCIAVVFTDAKGAKHRGHYTLTKHKIVPQT